jgi:hypothetical protein
LENGEEKEVGIEHNVDRKASIDDPSMYFLRSDSKKERTHCEAKESCSQDVE